MKTTKTAFFLTVVFLLTAVMCNVPQSYAGEKVYRWKIQSAYPRGDVSMELLKEFASEAKKKSNGRLKISVFADPELVPGEQLFDATTFGTIHMVHGLGAMWAGVAPVGEVEFGLPYAYRTPGMSFKESAEELRSFFYESGLVALLREEYAKHGLYWLDMHSYGPNFILSTKPVKTLEDMSGLKITLEGSFNQFMNQLGARGVVVSGTETYMALKLGTVDAAQWDVSAITALKWHEVAPYWIKGGENHQSFGHILINMKAWNKLPEDLKKVMHEGAKVYWDKLIDAYDSELRKVQALVDTGKVKESYIDAACQKAHEAAAMKVWDTVASGDAANAKAINLIKAWREKIKG